MFENEADRISMIENRKTIFISAHKWAAKEELGIKKLDWMEKKYSPNSK